MALWRLVLVARTEVEIGVVAGSPKHCHPEGWHDYLLPVDLKYKTMKKILIPMLAVPLCRQSAQAQFRKVPSDVTNAFKAKFPDAKDLEWKDRLTYFRAILKTTVPTCLPISILKGNGWKPKKQ